jgi:hypothetical protein
MKKLDKEFCLVAISGDCSKEGMCSYNEAIPFQNQHIKLVKKFLKAQNDLELAFMFCEYGTASSRKSTNKFYDAFAELRDLGIFEHKWHGRTSWKVTFNSKDDLNEEHAPFKIQKRNYTKEVA